MIDGQIFSYQLVKSYLRRYNIQKIATGQGDDYTTGCLLNYPYFKEHYKMIVRKNCKHLLLIWKQYSKFLLLEI